MGEVLDDLVRGSFSWDDGKSFDGSVSPGARRYLKGLVAEEYARGARAQYRKEVFSGLRRSVRKAAVYLGFLGAFGAGYLLRGVGVSGPVDAPSVVSSVVPVEEEAPRAVVVDARAADSLLRRSYDRLSVENAVLRRQQEVLLVGDRRVPEAPVEAIDSLLVGRDEYFIEVNKPDQRLRVWRLGPVLVADVPCSTGRVVGEKGRSGDLQTPSGYFTITSVEESGGWVHDGVFAYGDYFARLNFGSWDASGAYHPRGRSSIGIHATPEVGLLGFEASEGCARIYNPVLRKFVDEGIIAPGVQGFIVPYSHESLLSSDAGVGRERLRNYSGYVVRSVLKPVVMDSGSYGTRVVGKGGE